MEAKLPKVVSPLAWTSPAGPVVPLANTNIFGGSTHSSGLPPKNLAGWVGGKNYHQEVHCWQAINARGSMLARQSCIPPPQPAQPNTHGLWQRAMLGWADSDTNLKVVDRTARHSKKRYNNVFTTMFSYSSHRPDPPNQMEQTFHLIFICLYILGPGSWAQECRKI